MIRKFILGLAAVGILWGCNNKEKEVALQSEIDSLRTELQESQQTAEALQEVGVMIDSIDASRQLLRTDMVEGASYQDYKNRLASIREYVNESQAKIAELEKNAQKSRGYQGTIRRLKADLDKTTQMLMTLEDEVKNVRAENKSLTRNVSSRDSIIILNEMALRQREENLATLESQMQELNVESKNFQAESYFNQAKALEEAANRTQFAPRKKKKAQQEALDLYKKALELGKDEAQVKVEELEKDLG
jgi:DNA repair exonuclease SbcCD ATPase subunit